MKALSITIIIFITFIIFIVPVQAADSTPSADIKLKLEELKKEIASKAALLKQVVDKKLKDKAYIGQVKTKSSTSLTLATKSGPKIVSVNEDTGFVSRVRAKKYSQKAVSEEDYLAALGDVDERGVLTAKKIILLPTPNSEYKTYLWGQIVSTSDKLVTLKDAKLKNVALSLTQPSTVKVSDFVILTGFFGKNNIFKVEFVYIIPQGGILRPKKIGTPSAQTKSTTSSAKQK